MKKTMLYTIGILSACMLGGCQSGTNSETEELRRQVADLQQQISELQQTDHTDAADTDTTADPNAPATDTTADSGASATDTTTDPDAADTDDTLETLTALVDNFTSRIDDLLIDSRNKELEQFFSYKQEAAGIDRRLDRYEDELERQVRGGSLSRDDYRSMERELEDLEDRLDNAEDSLEYYYGIDD